MFSLARKNKGNQKGFTIVELLIVIVVIGILATLVLVTFTGIQKKARDSQRQTDIQAVNSQVAAFYTNYGFYPTLADLQSSSFVSTYLKGLDPQALVDPKGPSKTIGATVAADQYSYVASGTGCTNTTANALTGGVPVDNGCDTYALTANLESGGTYAKASN
jgi:type IV pilus assembly protein PilA